MLRWRGQGAQSDTTAGGLYPWRLRYFLQSASAMRLIQRWCRRSHESISQLRRRRLHRFGKSVRNNLHNGPKWNAIVKRRDVTRFHSDAAVTGRTTDHLFLRCAVNVDATLIGMGVLSFQPTYP